MPEEDSTLDTAQQSGDPTKDSEQLGCMQLGTCGALKFDDGSALHDTGFSNDDLFVEIQGEELDNAMKERRNFTFPAMLMSEGLRNGYWYDGERLAKATARDKKPLVSLPLVGATGEHKHEFYSQIGRLHSFKFNKEAKRWDCLAEIWNDPHIPKAAQAVAIGKQLGGKLPISLRTHGDTYVDPVHGLGIDNFEFVHGSVVLDGADSGAAIFTNSVKTDPITITGKWVGNGYVWESGSTDVPFQTVWTTSSATDRSTPEKFEEKEEPKIMAEEKQDAQPETVVVNNAVDTAKIKEELLAELRASNDFMTREEFDNALEHEKKVLNLLHLDKDLEEFDNLLRTMPSDQLDTFMGYVEKKNTATAEMQAKIGELEGKQDTIDPIKPTDGPAPETVTADNADDVLEELAKGGSTMAADLLAKRKAIKGQKAGE